MSISASPELISLCHSQLSLLQSWGAAYSVVYLTEEAEDRVQTHFVPILIYPETANVAVENASLPMLPAGAIAQLPATFELDIANPEELKPVAIEKSTSIVPEKSLKPSQQILLPLIHERLVMGLLVTVRQDRRWNRRERQQIEKIAQTLAIACVVEKQQGWLKQQLVQHRQLQSQQRDILDNLLHQIRSPLTAIRTFGKLLFKRLLPENPNQEIVTGIVQQSDRLKELLEQVDACLDLADSPPLLVDSEASESKSSSLLLLPGTSTDDGELTTEPYAVTNILEPLIVSAIAMAEEKQQQVFNRINPDLPLIKANPPALREVLSNIIDNAIKYTPAGGKIWVEAGVKLSQSTRADNRNNPEFLDITITDTGYGINPADLDRVFERSYRGEQVNTGIPGTGLGLAIAKELIEKMQGKIEVRSPVQTVKTNSETIKMGTSFTVWLPIRG
jgi:signal transduction histidine kinase